jgi:hypothetical protein
MECRLGGNICTVFATQWIEAACDVKRVTFIRRGMSLAVVCHEMAVLCSCDSFSVECFMVLYQLRVSKTMQQEVMQLEIQLFPLNA